MRRWKKKLKACQRALREYVVEAAGSHCGECGTWEPKYSPGEKCSTCEHIFGSERIWVKPLVIRETQILYRARKVAIDEITKLEDEHVFHLLGSI